MSHDTQSSQYEYVRYIATTKKKNAEIYTQQLLLAGAFERDSIGV
jgi:hypothetical protein